jgi:hypothetical protein
MNRLIVSLTLASVLLCAQPLSQGDRGFAMSHLHASRKLFLDSIAGLSESQWKFKPAPDRWSIAECAEHITLSQDSLFQFVTGKVLKSPAKTVTRTEDRSEDEAVIRLVRDRSHKAQAPEDLQPAGRWPAREALIKHFKESRDRIIAYVENTQEDLRRHFAPFPPLGELDAYQWILFLSAHTERHVEQINDVKSDPRFPSR